MSQKVLSNSRRNSSRFKNLSANAYGNFSERKSSHQQDKTSELGDIQLTEKEVAVPTPVTQID